MPRGLSLTEQFLVRFNTLRAAANNDPERVLRFGYKNSKAIRDALDGLHNFLARADFERRVFHGVKVVGQPAPGFEAAWKEYTEKWHLRVTRPAFAIPIRLSDSDADPDPDGSILADLEERAWKESEVELEAPPTIELVAPDPETENSFDPLRHDGGAALELGIEYLESPVAGRLDLEGSGLEDELEWANRSSIALSAFDYLTETIGLDVHGVFRRWRKVPVVFMPAHVSNRYGASDKGSLAHLLDDAIRAYVFGAPAATLVLCRAAFEMILKQHYGDGEWEDPKEKLAKVMALANERGFIKREEIRPLIERADGILHRYAQEAVLSAEDERTILIFLGTLKSLIELAPKP